jgi:hypothetical protein
LLNCVGVACGVLYYCCATTSCFAALRAVCQERVLVVISYPRLSLLEEVCKSEMPSGDNASNWNSSKLMFKLVDGRPDMSTSFYVEYDFSMM